MEGFFGSLFGTFYLASVFNSLNLFDSRDGLRRKEGSAYGLRDPRYRVTQFLVSDPS